LSAVLARSGVGRDETKQSAKSEQQKGNKGNGLATSLVLPHTQFQFVVAVQRVPDIPLHTISHTIEHLDRSVPLIGFFDAEILVRV
jgi:hypothetical protein